MELARLITTFAAGEYLEEYERGRFLWRNYRHAISARQKAFHWAAILERQARHAASGSAAARLRKMGGYFSDAEVEAVNTTGLAHLERICLKKLEREHATELFINRCERCGRIVASPVACACQWCGHHRYERRAELRARAASSIYPGSASIGRV